MQKTSCGRYFYSTTRGFLFQCPFLRVQFSESLGLFCWHCVWAERLRSNCKIIKKFQIYSAPRARIAVWPTRAKRELWVRIPYTVPTKNALLSTKTKVRFLNDVCLRQMMTATPNDVRFANDVCLTAHDGKHRIIAERSGATSYLRSKCIISPQAMHH